MALADATWYGSFRAIMHSQDGHTTMKSNGSRWGVKGSSEVSEGLTAVYLYEENLDLGTATIKDDNRLSYVGLSGGFGSITMGQVWSATYNHPGVLTDNGIWSGNSGLTTARTNNTVSYAAATGPISFQVDMQMDPKGDVADRSVDMSQIGMSIDTGFATVALGAKNKATADRTSKEKNGSKKLTSIAVSVPVGGFTVAAGWHQLKTKMDAQAAVRAVDATPGKVGSAAMAMTPEIDMKDKQTQFSLTGPLGDTGMSFGMNFADVDKGDDTDAADGSNPWNVHAAKSLGGGASVALEYIDADTGADDDTETVVQLRVDF